MEAEPDEEEGPAGPTWAGGLMHADRASAQCLGALRAVLRPTAAGCAACLWAEARVAASVDGPNTMVNTHKCCTQMQSFIF